MIKFQLLVYTNHIQCIKNKHIQNLAKQSLYTESGTVCSLVPIGRLVSNLGGSVGRSDSGVVVVVVVVVV